MKGKSTTFVLGVSLCAYSSLAGALPPVDQIKRSLNQYRTQVCAKRYMIEGRRTNPVLPTFRLPNYEPPAQTALGEVEKTLKAQNLWKDDLHQKIFRAVQGRASCEEIAEITQLLIDAGQLSDGKSPEERIRAMMGSAGIGMDCQGYVAYAAPYALGKTAAELATAGAQSAASFIRLDEGAYIRSQDPLQAQAGDIIFLKSTNGGYDHTVVVGDVWKVGASTASAWGDPDGFLGNAQQVVLLEVDSSWGSSGDPQTGGVERRKWLYNPDTKQWATIDDNQIQGQGVAPAQDHVVKGIYRAAR